MKPNGNIIRICGANVANIAPEVQLMKFILGIFVGAALMLGSAYLHDTRMVRVGPAQPFVNWDIVVGMLGR
jgi:hypothetical protein